MCVFVAAYTMVQFRSTLIPQQESPTAEAELARHNWNASSSMEFVHVHKSGGTTFNHVASTALCGNQCSEPCCVIRPTDVSKLKEARFFSALQEFSAYVLPWNVFKVVMVRRPWQRWVSETVFGCHTKNWTVRSVGDAYAHNDRSVRWNRLADGLVPPSVLGKKRLTGDALTSEEEGVARKAIYAFAFVGVLEAYDRSMCLFARTFAQDQVCKLCCQTTPHYNARRDDKDVCRYEFSESDRILYESRHAADIQTYQIAKATFDARWDIASSQRWSSDLCRCKFVT